MIIFETTPNPHPRTFRLELSHIEMNTLRAALFRIKEERPLSMVDVSPVSAMYQAIKCVLEKTT